MPDSEPWYRKYRPVLIFIIVLALLVFIPGSHESRVNARNSSLNQDFNTEPTDTTQTDEIDSESVNLERLKQFVQTNNNVPVDTAGLDSQINEIIDKNSDIIFGISIKDINTGSFYNYGNLDAMTAASVSKVLTATDYFKEVELGHKTLDAIMENGYTALVNIEQMIVVSDNDAWHVLNDSLTYQQMQNYAISIGISSYDYANNTMSASDTAKLFADLYERKLIIESNTQLLLSYMERANYRDLIIPAVPTYDTVYHKAGELYANLNDVAIITNSTQAIVLSIYSESLYGYDKTRVSSLMQQITNPTLQTFQLN